MKKRKTQANNRPRPDNTILTAQVIHDDFKRFLSYMPNPDNIAVGTFESYSTYREMMDDPRIKSLVNTLKTKALNFPFRIVQGEGVRDEVYDFVINQPLFKSKFYSKMKRALTSLNYGFSVTEAIWEYRDANYHLDTLITRKPERFVFDHDWNLYWMHMGEKRLLDDDYKWLLYQHDPDDENPYGTSILKCVHWPWLFKKAGYEFWLMATEKFSVQTILALFEMTGSEDAIRARAHEIASLLENVASGSATGIGNVREVKEIGAQGHVSEFNALVDACDVQIAYGLTTQAVATNNPERGTQALGTVAADLMDGDTKGIALECQTLAQKLIDWTVRLNFGDDYISPTAEFDTEKKAGFADVMSAVDRNIPVSKSVLYDYYKIPRPKDEEDAFVKPETSADEFILSDPSGTSIGSKKKRRRVVIV